MTAGEAAGGAPAAVAPDLPYRERWTVDDLPELPDGPLYDLVDGQLLMRSPTQIHLALCHAVASAVRTHCPPGYAVAVERSVKLDLCNQPRLSVLAVRDEPDRRGPAPAGSVALAIDVASEPPSGTTLSYGSIMAKALVLAGAGIAGYWVIEQQHPEIWLERMSLKPSGGSIHLEGSTTGILSITEPWPITVDLPALTAQRAAIRRRTAGSGATP